MFGSPLEYGHDADSAVHKEDSLPLVPVANNSLERHVTAAAYEVINLNALEDRQGAGVAVTGEYIPEICETALIFFKTHGHPVDVQGCTVTSCVTSPFWSAWRSYYQTGDYGGIYQHGAGIMSITGVARLTGHQDLCATDFDVVAGKYEMYLRKLQPLTMEQEFCKVCELVERSVLNGDASMSSRRVALFA